MTKIIKSISAIESYSVRHLVLRQGKPVESCHFEGDTLSSTRHFGLFLDDVIVGVASLFKQKNKLFEQDRQYQLRGMAVLPSHQRNGLGEDLIDAAEKYVRENNGEIIWLNARVAAVNFYKKLGYELVGMPFDIKDVGTHYIMSKNF